MTTKKFLVGNFFDPQNGQNLSILVKMAFLSVFGLFLSNAIINFHNVWYGNFPCSLPWENHSVYAGKFWDGQNLAIWDKIWSFFGQNWQFWGFLAYNFQPPLWIFLILVWTLFLWSSLRKSYYKCQENYEMAIFWPLAQFLAKIDSFESFLPTSKRGYESSQFFCMEVVVMVFFEKIILGMIFGANLSDAKIWASA